MVPRPRAWVARRPAVEATPPVRAVFTCEGPIEAQVVDGDVRAGAHPPGRVKRLELLSSVELGELAEAGWGQFREMSQLSRRARLLYRGDHGDDGLTQSGLVRVPSVYVCFSCGAYGLRDAIVSSFVFNAALASDLSEHAVLMLVAACLRAWGEEGIRNPWSDPTGRVRDAAEHARLASGPRRVRAASAELARAVLPEIEVEVAAYRRRYGRGDPFGPRE